MKFPDLRVFKDESVSRSADYDATKALQLSEIAEETVKHHLPQGGYKPAHALAFFATGKKGDKFRLCLLLQDEDTYEWVLITCFGSVEYAHLRVDEIHRAGTERGKPVADVFEYDQLRRCPSLAAACRQVDRGVLRAVDHQDNTRFMEKYSEQLTSHLTETIDGSVAEPEKPTQDISSFLNKFHQVKAQEQREQREEEHKVYVEQTRDQAYGDW